MCNCKDVSFGSYDNQVTVDVPCNITLMRNDPEQTKIERLSIDACIADEVQFLWGKGILTNGCCCGHNIDKGFIGVNTEFEDAMKELGYKVRPNPYDDRQNEFYPKSV